MNFERKKLWSASAVLGALWFVSACTPERDPATLFAPEAVGVVVVNATLIVGESLPLIRLTRTQEPDAPYDDDSGIILANMSVSFDDQVITYRSLNQSGQYQPLAGSVPLVLPSTTYDLLVTTPQGERLSGSTTTPEVFDISEWSLTASDGSLSCTLSSPS